MLRTALTTLALSTAVLAQAPAAPTTAERMLARLTLEERAAQIMMSWTLSRTDASDPQLAEIRRQVEVDGIGGVVLSIGTTADAVALVSDLQAHARLPLLVAGDFENGVAFRLADGTDFGPQMLLGATGSSALAWHAGRATGIEARAMGFAWDFAPVLDVNVNPANPIIQIRSFGEDPALVARLGVAWTGGLQSTGVVATGKHFPGHGDVSTDSHLSLPVVPADRARLDAVELVPFRAAIRNGIGALMTGHLSVAGLGEDPAVPATLSRRIMTDLLRGELGFDGILVTDALDMGGVKVATPVEATIRALAAGADLLLMPPDPTTTRDAIAAAVRDGRIPQERLDQACLRILRLKERAGLLSGAGLPDHAWRDHVATPAHAALADEIAARGLTLARDPSGFVPIRADDLVVVTFAADAQAGAALVAELAASARSVDARRLTPTSPRDDVDGARAAILAGRARGAAVVLAVAHGRTARVPPAFGPLAELAAEPDSVVVVLGNPFAPKAIPDRCAVLLAYGDSPRLERAAARALLGDAAVTGRAPVTVPDACARGAGLTWLPPSTALPHVAPPDEGFAPDLAPRIADLLRTSVARRVFPGAVAVVARRGRVVAAVAVGRETYDAEAPQLRVTSLFDLASLTKVCATTPAVLRLVDAGRLSLDARVQDLIPAFRGGDKDAVTLRHLLTHSAGLPAYVKFFETLEGRDAILAAAAAVSLESAPGARYRYSDLGMMLTMQCVEVASGEPFDRFVAREVFAPLGMTSATFTRSGAPIDAVPTEDDPWRGRVVRGEVHDENAFAMGGVSGHAGLFADAFDVTRLGQAFLGGGRGLAAPALVREFVRRQEVVAGDTRALGWDTFAPGGSGGTKLSAAAFGHTGFTGTSIWCDPTRDLSIVLLTNRVHPTRENQRHTAVRRALADLVVDCLEDDPR